MTSRTSAETRPSSDLFYTLPSKTLRSPIPIHVDRGFEDLVRLHCAEMVYEVEEEGGPARSRANPFSTDRNYTSTVLVAPAKDGERRRAYFLEMDADRQMVLSISPEEENGHVLSAWISPPTRVSGLEAQEGKFCRRCCPFLTKPLGPEAWFVRFSISMKVDQNEKLTFVTR